MIGWQPLTLFMAVDDHTRKKSIYCFKGTKDAL